MILDSKISELTQIPLEVIDSTTFFPVTIGDNPIVNRKVSLKDIVDNQLNTLTDLIEAATGATEAANSAASGATEASQNATESAENANNAADYALSVATGITDELLILHNLITGETEARIIGDNTLYEQLTGETLDRTNTDILLFNQITGETQNRELDDIRLNNLITGETSEREIEDLRLNNLITGESYNRIVEDVRLNNLITGLTDVVDDNYNLLTGETEVRVLEDIRLNNLITGETENRVSEDSRLNNSITGLTEIVNYNYSLLTGETENRISADQSLYNEITGETQSRILEDIRLNNLITGETQDRVNADNSLFNQITGLTQTVNHNYNLLTGETENRISADQSLYDEITGETQSRTLEDIRLNNLITGLTETVNNNYTLLTGETQDRINQDFLLFAQITGLSETVSDNYNLITGLTQTVNDNYALLTGETEDRTTEDSRLNDLLTGLTETVNINYNLLTGETEDRILEDIRLNNLITGETEDRTIEDARLNDLITGETYNRITGDTALYNQLTGETNDRINEDIRLNNLITGETQDRINSDSSLLNQITGLTEIVNDNYNTFTGHTHNALYNSNDNSKVVYVDNGGNVHIDADIYQSGSTYETHAEDIYTTNDYIILRDGATTSLAEGQYAGFEAIKYDGLNNGRLVFDNTGTARVGDVGSEQPLATRSESENMSDGGIVYWSTNDNKIVTDPIKDSALFSQITAETANRTSEDAALANQITAETANRTTEDAILYNYITAETATRISEDYELRSLITGYTGSHDEITAETANRIFADNILNNQITAETATRISEDDNLGIQISTGYTELYNQITAETESRINEDTFLNYQITAETNTRINEDATLYNEITAETENRISSDVSLNNLITAETANRVEALKDYIPYTGATGNINLGINNLTVGANTLLVDSVNNNVGIGTTSPKTKLDVNGNLIATNITGTTFVKTSGASSQFLMADGSVDTYGTTVGTVAEGNHTHEYLPLSGGTLTGQLKFDYTFGNLANILFRNTRIESTQGGWSVPHLTITNLANEFVYSEGMYGSNAIPFYSYFGFNSAYYSESNFRVYNDRVAFGSNTIYHTGNISGASVNYAVTAGSAPASDVYSWAKQSTKPTYTYTEVGAASSGHTHNNATTSASGFMSSSDKTFLDRFSGYNSGTTLTSLPITKQVAIVTVTGATTLSLADTLPDGYEILIKLMNGTGSEITQPLPTSSPFDSKKNDGTAISSVKLPASGRIEISLLAINGTYYIKTDA